MGSFNISKQLDFFNIHATSKDTVVGWKLVFLIESWYCLHKEKICNDLWHCQLKEHLRKLQKQLMQFLEMLYKAVSQMNDL